MEGSVASGNGLFHINQPTTYALNLLLASNKKKYEKLNLKVGNCAIFITYIILYYYIYLPSPFRSVVRSFVCCTQIERANEVTCTERGYKAMFLRVSAYEVSTTTKPTTRMRIALLCLCDFSCMDIDWIATPVKMDSPRKLFLSHFHALAHAIIAGQKRVSLLTWTSATLHMMSLTDFQ